MLCSSIFRTLLFDPFESVVCTMTASNTSCYSLSLRCYTFPVGPTIFALRFVILTGYSQYHGICGRRWEKQLVRGRHFDLYVCAIMLCKNPSRSTLQAFMSSSRLASGSIPQVSRISCLTGLSFKRMLQDPSSQHHYRFAPQSNRILRIMSILSGKLRHSYVDLKHPWTS
jgi:hypothetical protein